MRSLGVAVNAWFWDQPGTGSGQYVRYLLPALAALAPGTRFYPIVPAGKEVCCQASNVQPVYAGNWRTGQLGRPFGHRIWDVYKLWFEQMMFPRMSATQRAGVAHVPYFGPPARPTTPTVVTVHDLIPMVLPAYRGSALVRAYTLLAAVSARRADVIIADSESSRRDIAANLKVEPQRVCVIPLAVDPGFRPATPEEVEFVRRRYGLPDRYVLYLGGFDQRKNVGLLLQAFARVQAGRSETLQQGGRQNGKPGLVIAGRLPEQDSAFTPDPRRIVARLGIEESVVFPGWIAERDKPALYSSAELFVFPSVYEGFGLPVLEAMACGSPIVTSSASSLPEVVGEAGITVDPHDVDALVTAMSTVLGDGERRHAMRQASLEQACRFSWERTAEATLHAYSEACSGDSADPIFEE